MANTAQYKTADEAQTQLIADGWTKDNYDLLYPFVICFDNNDAMRARINWCDRRQAYIVEGIYI